MGAFSAGTSARVLGRYVLHGELASGGMATVHLARLLGEAGFARTVAIKRLHPQFARDPEFVAMFVDEARLAARVRHPNVVPTLDVLNEGGEIFLVMEYVHGESLSRLLRAMQLRKEPVPPTIATTVLAGVLHGLHAAHEARSEKGDALQIVHRDVSPQNVLVGVDGMAHVLDFGVAKAAGRVQTTREGQLKGKLSYMAPEQFSEAPLTRLSDVYAAAVVLWETLTLRRLFDADNEASLLMKVLEGKITPPGRLVKIPSGLDAVVMRGLERDPARRWQTARDFALALEKVAGVAPASEIGEWVQSIAGTELAKRARKLSEIERGSVRMLAASELKSEPPPPLQSTPPAETPSDVRVAEPRSQVSTISVSKSDYALAPPPRVRTGRGWFLAGGAAGLLFVLLFFGFSRGGSLPPRHIATLPPPIVGAGTSPSPPPAAAVPEPAVTIGSGDDSEAEAPAPAPTGTTGLAGDAPSVNAGAGAGTPHPRAVVKKTTTANDCDPPYTRDARGHKIYKMQCL